MVVGFVSSATPEAEGGSARTASLKIKSLGWGCGSVVESLPIFSPGRHWGMTQGERSCRETSRAPGKALGGRMLSFGRDPQGV